MADEHSLQNMPQVAEDAVSKRGATQAPGIPLSGACQVSDIWARSGKPELFSITPLAWHPSPSTSLRASLLHLCHQDAEADEHIKTAIALPCTAHV